MNGRQEWKQRFLKGMSVFLLAAASIMVLPTTAPAATKMVVTGNIVNVRSGPSTADSIVGKVQKNDSVNSLETRGDWHKITYNGVEGWVAGWLLANSTATSPSGSTVGTTPKTRQAVVTVSTVNVRSGPGTSYGVVAKINKGENYTVAEVQGQWIKINLPTGNTGWVAGWLVTVSEASSPPKTAQPTPVPPSQNQTITTPKTRKAIVTASTINVRTGPGTSYGVVAKINKGEKYTVAEVKGHWIRINLSGGKSGWVAGWLVTVSETEVKPVPNSPVPNPPAPSQPVIPQPSENNKEAVVQGDNVYIRGGPGTSHGAVRLVSRGQRLGVLEQAGDWYKVSTDGGVIGWVAGWLINVEQAEASPSPGDPPVKTEDTDRSGEMPAGLTTKLEKLEVNNKKEHTLISLKANGQLNYDMFLLSNPDRLVVDLKNIDPGDLPDTIAVGTDAVQQIRTGWFSKEPPVLRIVFDLKGSVVNLDKLSADRTQLDLDIYIPADGSYLMGRVIVIDPGHGGQEPGVVGSTGLREKDINLDIGLKLARILTEKGAKVVMTRTGDTTVGLYDRTPMAAASGADVFLSIHNNGSTSPNSNGTSTYYRQDSGDVAPGVSQADNQRLASAIQSELLRTLGRRNLGVLQANFVVLRTSPVPAALAEIAFVSNPEEEQLLSQETFRMRAAEALARGLNTYFSTAR